MSNEQNRNTQNPNRWGVRGFNKQLLLRRKHISSLTQNWFTNIDDIHDIYGDNETSKIIIGSNKLLNSLSRTDILSTQEIIQMVNTYPALAKWIPDYGVQLLNLYKTHNLTFETPLIAEDIAGDNNKRKWLLRKQFNYSGWYTLNNIFSKTDWEYRNSGWGSYSGYNIVGTRFTKDSINYTQITLIRFFIPSEMPIGYKHIHSSTLYIRINGTNISVTNKTNPGYSNIATIPYDFSTIIKLNQINWIALTWQDRNDTWLGFGLY